MYGRRNGHYLSCKACTWWRWVKCFGCHYVVNGCVCLIFSLSSISSSVSCIFNRLDSFASAERKSGHVLRSKEWRTVVNIFGYIKRLRHENNCEVDYLWNCLSHWNLGNIGLKIGSGSARGTLAIQNKKGRSKGMHNNSRYVKYGDFIRSSVRRKFHEFYFWSQPLALN
jgi:hypothetical protein